MRYWVMFRILTALVASGIVIAWSSRYSFLVTAAGAAGAGEWRTVLSGVASGFASVFVLVAGLVAIPFEVYIITKRRDWYLYLGLIAIGFNVVHGVIGYLESFKPQADPVLASFGRGDWIFQSVTQFAYFYYVIWVPLAIPFAVVALFVRRREPEWGDGGDSPTARTAFDSGPTLGYLGVLLGGTSVAQAFADDWTALAVQLAIGVALVAVVFLLLTGYRRVVTRT
ncbi:hypothetical protein [Allokutzneria oryzae]|uniref:Uncharacterized protein n=1 Tax=Allokutzneria oryzae TaxID=1378989 RepID=A0ABV6A384_9PSEU